MKKSSPFYQPISPEHVQQIDRKGRRILDEIGISITDSDYRERLEDAGENIGPLFSKPPNILSVGSQAWREIKTIVVGEEGSGRGRWRTEFSPDSDRVDQDLPPEILDKRGGWYFLRFYDGNDDLAESLDFRFLSGL